MDIWALEKWKIVYSGLDCQRRSGLRLRFDKEVNDTIKEACKGFCKWLRYHYNFPIRIPIYIKRYSSLLARDGDIATAIIWMPFSRQEEPYIRIAAGSYRVELSCNSQPFPLFYYIAHELTHYFQWINDLQYTKRGEEWQASYYANRIVYEYKEYCDLRMEQSYENPRNTGKQITKEM